MFFSPSIKFQRGPGVIESNAHRLSRIISMIGIVLIIAYVVGAMIIPRRVPRFSVLPKPTVEVTKTGCVTESDDWEKHRLVWRQLHITTVTNCEQQIPDANN